MKIIVGTLITVLVVLLILLLGGLNTFGWVMVALISAALIFIALGFYIIVPYMNKKDKDEMIALEKRIKEKEEQGYTEEELKDLKKKLYLMKKIHG